MIEQINGRVRSRLRLRVRSALFPVCLLSPLVAGGVAAQVPDTIRLEEIVVTATKLPLPRTATTAVVTVLHGEELRARGAHTVADALRTTPSAMVVQNGSLGSLTSLFLRGGESDYVQVLVDGVRVNNPGGVFDFANLTLDQVDRIEIVRGPVSVLYGSDAVTGVVQIFTRRGAGTDIRLRAGGGGGQRVVPDSMSAERYATSTVAVDAQVQKGRISGAAGIARLGSGGLYAFNNQYANYTGSLRAVLNLGGSTELGWSARYTDSEFHYPTDGTGNLSDQNQWRTTESFTTGLELSSRRERWSGSLRAGLHHNLERYEDPIDGPADTLGTNTSRSRGRVRRSFVEGSGHYSIGAQSIISVGSELERQEDRNRYDSNGQFGPFSSRFGKTRNNRALYAQAVHALRALRLNGGVRLDSNDRFGDFVTYRAGTALVLSSTRLRFAAGSAFKEPTFFENYAEGFTRGNPNLAPEQSRTWEVGIEQTLPRGRGLLQVTHFRQRFRDLIQYVQQPFGSTEPNYTNIAAANSNGTEFELSLRPATPLELTAALTLLQTKALDRAGVDDPQFEPGLPLIRRPERLARIAGSYSFGAWEANASWSRVGSRADLDFSTFPSARVQLDAYSTLDVGVSVTALKLSSAPVKLWARAENLLDERYEEVLNFPARGRFFSLSAELTLSHE